MINRQIGQQSLPVKMKRVSVERSFEDARKLREHSASAAGILDCPATPAVT